MLGSERGAHLGRVGDVHHVEPDAPWHEHFGEQAVGAAVHVVADEHIVAGTQGGAQQHVDRREPGGEAHRICAAFDGRELLVERGACWVDRTAVVVAVAHLTHTVLLERGCHEDRGDNGARGGVGRLAGVDGAGGHTQGGVLQGLVCVCAHWCVSVRG